MDPNGPGGLMNISRPSGKRPLVLLVAPLAAPDEILGLPLARAGPAAVVFVHDPEARKGSSDRDLQRLYRLSRSEARVAVAIRDGERPEEVADRLCVSVHTVRSHLRRIFSKTSTNRQADLVRLLLSQPATRGR
jgi:DNA-binding CsgD family transcriptional regulator